MDADRMSERGLTDCLAQWRAADDDLLLFAYGSLIWRPDFAFSASTLARVQGYHRALRMRSPTHRGCREQPGLVLALLSGGSCRGLVYRVPKAEGEAVLGTVWTREMVNDAYQPRWLPCATAHGVQRALSFTLSRRSPHCAEVPTDAELLHILRHARGGYGSTLDYLANTVRSLRSHGIRDVALERQLHLAVQHGLIQLAAG
jgi:cation transport protein ChaC